MLHKINRIAQRLARPDIMFYCLPWLMILLIAGTVAQREMGLYHAERLFFSSWVLWLGFIPLPGGYMTMGAMFINLAAKFMFKSTWSWKQSGTIITHFGILLLFIGAIITATTTQEGFVLIHEGAQENIIQDYHHRSLFIHKNQELEQQIAFKDINKNPSLPLDHAGLKIEIIDICKHCSFTPTPEGSENEERKGLAQKITLADIPPLKEHEANQAGITFQVSGAEDNQNGLYVSTEAAPHKVEIADGDDTYTIQLKRNERPLPFKIHLTDFVRELHPGTMTAKNYHSDIELIDGDVRWPVRIGMNAPLRYKGYTFFQSSFVETPKGETTILAVVKNSGWLFPYIASAVIAFGLLLHMIVRRQ